MAVTTEYSNVAAAQRSATQTVASDLFSSRVVQVTFSFTQPSPAGDANSVAVLFQTPTGRCRLLAHQSTIKHSAFGAARLLSLGWLAYTDEHGEGQAASLTGICSGIDVALAGTVALGPLVTIGADFLFETPRWLAAQCTGATLPVGGQLTGTFLLALG
jgi:hypothetical protein